MISRNLPCGVEGFSCTPREPHPALQLTWRLELLLRSVLAQPKLSNSGFVASTMSLMSPMSRSLASPVETAAMYCMMRLAASVLPAPLSPEMMTHWFSLYACML